MKKTANNQDLITKMELVKELAKKSKLTHSVAKSILNNLLDIIERNLKKEKRLQIIGFGSFYTKQKPARTAINPNTRKPIQVPEKKLVKFAPGKALREAVNKK
ncbi:MAG: integration host factor [Candidatus Wallbacteria bacterium HGW-Wallbacteria-1]|jgi:DNA-binding protein HU-beta|uniref:Integration host factor n=1 Tax=Candidatus Wallbacteria bacterium HGW-Wallbacteria-1 TaxID=2013854 RepID=A0A2N1PJ98_9BACT|nr:MAG: integration host factor [Candidatus Wallbacteria bacterium HGW-Wallbacteria-1]